MANANWSNPTLTSTYTNFVSEVKNRDEDLALQFDGTTSTNIPTNAIRWDSSAGRWKKWNGTSWAELAATYALTSITTTGSLATGTSIQAGTTGGTQGIYVGQTGLSGALLYRSDGSVQLSARSSYPLTFAPAPDSSTEWARFSSGGFFGVGITPRTKVDVSGTQLTDAGLSATLGPLLAWNTTNNVDTTGLQTVFTIGRANKSVSSYANLVNFNIGRYSQTGTAAQTQLTLRLSNGSVNNPDSDIVTFLASGYTGFGTLVPTAKVETQTTVDGDGIRLSYNNTPTVGTGSALSYRHSNNAGTLVTTAAVKAIMQSGGVGSEAASLGFYTIYAGSYAERMRLASNGDLGLGTTTPRGDFSIANNTTGSVVSTSLHLGYSNVDFYGYRLVNTSNPSSTAAGTFALQRGTTSAWVDALSVDNAGLITVANGLSGGVTRSTAVATTSGTGVSFTSLPSWVKKITILLDSVSFAGADDLSIRVQVGGTSVTSGYTEEGGFFSLPSTLGTVTGTCISSNGSMFYLYNNSAVNIIHGCVKLMNITGNIWTMQATYNWGVCNVGLASGRVSLAGTLTGIELRSASGLIAFDNGTVNILYEG